MTKTYNVADYAMHTGTQLVIILDHLSWSPDNVWVHFVHNNGDHNGLMRLVRKLDLSNHRTADLLA
jgi:hypothetical protein